MMGYVAVTVFVLTFFFGRVYPRQTLSVAVVVSAAVLLIPFVKNIDLANVCR